MAATHSPLPSPLPPYPALSRLRETSPLERNASTSSSRSTTTVSSTTSSLVAVEMRPAPKETRTAVSGAGAAKSGSASSSNSDLPAGSAGPSSTRNYHPSPPEGVYGGRGFQRNGPRVSASPSPSLTGMSTSTSAPTARRLPAIITDDGIPLSPRPISSYLPNTGMSPTTPRAGRFLPRPSSTSTEVNDEDGLGVGGGGLHSSMGSIKPPPSPYSSKVRSSSTGGPGEAWERERERRQSVASARSAASAATATSSAGGRMRETTADYVFGEELGRGSYSTVVHAVKSPSALSNSSPISPRRPPRQFAVKIINQAHLIQERKTKYAMIERDALVRLNAPRASGPSGVGGPSNRGHRRGMSGPSAAPITPAPAQSQGQRPSTAGPGSRRGSAAAGGAGDRLGVASDYTSSSSNTATPSNGGIGWSTPTGNVNIPLSSPTLSNSTSTSASTSTINMGLVASGAGGGRRPSRSADPPEVVPERSDEGHDDLMGVAKSRPPSPVAEERESKSMEQVQQSRLIEGVEGRERERSGPAGGGRSTLPSKEGVKEGSKERSRRSGAAKGSHPGIIKLYSTFNDVTSLYFVLELAAKGELLTYLRKYGSLDIDSARYYAALLLDTVEFMHERGIVHRDLKPENILLDDEMRIKVTDFGSAKLVDKDGKDPKDQLDASGEGGTSGSSSRKRSFVGSADFVSPEVLRNEAALAASDVWAFGCIVYQLIVGKPPFRGATDYLTFQKILKREMIFPEGFDEDAKALVEVILNLDPSSRPNPSDLKVHPFFSSIDWRTLWQAPAPIIQTGITPPVVTLASVDPASDIWAVFEDEMSDNGLEPESPLRGPAGINEYSKGQSAHHDGNTLEPRYDRHAAAEAVWSVDSPDAPNEPRPNPLEANNDDLEPPRPAWMEAGQRKLRALSKGSSARTSSSSSGNRTALTGLLETMGIVSVSSGSSGSGMGGGGKGDGSGRTSRTSGSIKDLVEARNNGGAIGRVSSPVMSTGSRAQAERPQVTRADGRWNQLLLTNETIIHTSPISIRTSSNTSLLPSFLSPTSTKKRQLILTDLPRLFTVKEESPSTAIQTATSLSAASSATLSVKNECVFVRSDANGPNKVMDVVEKGSRGFNVQTSAQTFSYFADTAEARVEWMNVLQRLM